MLYFFNADQQQDVTKLKQVANWDFSSPITYVLSRNNVLYNLYPSSLHLIACDICVRFYRKVPSLLNQGQCPVY